MRLKKRKNKRLERIKKVARLYPPAVALRVLKGAKMKRKLKKYVAENGHTPSDNTEELATQTALIREEKINNIVEDNQNYPEIQDRDTAEQEYEEQEQEQEEQEGYDSESDNFSSDAIGSVLSVAKGFVSKIKNKRFAKGKKVLGKTKAQWEQKKGKFDVNTTSGGGLEISGLSDSGGDFLSETIKDAKKGTVEQTLKDNLPLISGCLAVAYFMFFRKK